jgi:hypothetical protein
MVGLVAAAGCGNSTTTRPNWAIVSGTVSYQGRALPAGDVLISPDADPTVFASGKIKDGRFALQAPIGPAKVGFQTADVKVGQPDLYVEIPLKYGDPHQSGLTCEVKSGENSDLKFDLQ